MKRILRKAKAVIEEMYQTGRSRPCKNEEILVFVDELGRKFGSHLGARAWVKNEDYWNARWRISGRNQTETG